MRFVELLRPILNVVSINDLPKNILKSCVNIYANSTAIYGGNSKSLEDQGLESDI